MAKSAKRPAAAPKRKAFRPLLFAGGLGLLWFVQYQSNGPPDEGPAWSHALLLSTRLLADIVGAWVAIAVAQLFLAILRAAYEQLRAESNRDML